MTSKTPLRNTLLTLARTGKYRTYTALAQAAGCSPSTASRHVPASLLAGPPPAPVFVPAVPIAEDRYATSYLEEDLEAARAAGYDLPDLDVPVNHMPLRALRPEAYNHVGALPLASGAFRLGAIEHVGRQTPDGFGVVPGFVEVAVPAGSVAHVYLRPTDDSTGRFEDIRVSSVRVVFADPGHDEATALTRWEHAQMNGDYEELGRFGVDAASAAYGDRDELTRHGEEGYSVDALAAEEGWNSVVDTSPRGVQSLVAGTGWGDGIYYVDVLRDADGRVAEVQVDFVAPDEGEDFLNPFVGGPLHQPDA